MPLVQVYVWRGISEEAKRRIIEGITEVFSEIGIPEEAVEILIHEVPKENWGVGGKQASERFGDVEPP